MTCAIVRLDGGITAIVCGRGGKRCRYCGRLSTQLCDGPRLDGAGTCDAPLCRRCAVRVVGHRDVDLCQSCLTHFNAAQAIALAAGGGQ